MRLIGLLVLSGDVTSTVTSLSAALTAVRSGGFVSKRENNAGSTMMPWLIRDGNVLIVHMTCKLPCLTSLIVNLLHFLMAVFQNNM